MHETVARARFALENVKNDQSPSTLGARFHINIVKKTER